MVDTRHTHIALDTKRLARRYAQNIRNSFPEPTLLRASDAIAANISLVPGFADCKVLLTYLPMGSEADTWRAIELALAHGKQIAAPRTHWESKSMDWYFIHGRESLERSALGIPEPLADEDSRFFPQDSNNPMMALVPGLMFDRCGYRLGYGGGFYDRFLQNFNGIAAGISLEGQLYPSLKEMGLVEAHDVELDYVVTEKGIYSACIC